MTRKVKSTKDNLMTQLYKHQDALKYPLNQTKDLSNTHNCRLVGNVVLRMNSTKLVNAVNTEETGMLKNYKANLKLNENVIPSKQESFQFNQ